ncbi:hypothetical protein [Clostridium haemolyticum]|nr:hypothetical protein [Clostridium haemolyticum]
MLNSKERKVELEGIEPSTMPTKVPYSCFLVLHEEQLNFII